LEAFINELEVNFWALTTPVRDAEKKSYTELTMKDGITPHCPNTMWEFWNIVARVDWNESACLDTPDTLVVFQTLTSHTEVM